jgi:hypothetical protein
MQLLRQAFILLVLQSSAFLDAIVFKIIILGLGSNFAHYRPESRRRGRYRKFFKQIDPDTDTDTENKTLIQVDQFKAKP